MDLDVLCDDPRWQDLKLEELATRALAATLAHLEIPEDPVSVSLLGCDDARIAELNADFRGKPTPTNVLSWPAEALSAAHAGGTPSPPQPGPDGEIALGDIALAFETCVGEAQAQKKSVEAHVHHLIVHGILHLLGYDHENDADAEVMERLEREILGKMGLDDPY